MKKRLLQFALICLTILLWMSCKKDKDNNMGCPLTLVAIPPPMYFNIIDQTTSKDLFFPIDAVYKKSQLVCYISHTYNNEKAIKDTIPINVDSMAHCFMIASFFDTIYMSIAGLPVDTLVQKSVKEIASQPCMPGYVNSVLFNNQLYNANSKRVIIFKK